MSTVPWVDAWRDEPSDEQLDLAVEVRAKPADFSSLTLHELGDVFSAKAGEVFLCDDQNRLLIRRMLAAGRAHARLNFLSKEDFDERVATDHPWIILPKAPLGISGLSGIGKSSLLKAMDRLAAGRRSQVDTRMLGNLPLRPMWTATVRDAGSVADILEQLLADGVDRRHDSLAAGDRGRSPAEASKRVAKVLKKLVRVRSYRNGVSLIALDELQFGSKGDACTWITSLVLQLMGFGPLVVYSTNYSLLHKLSAGNNEVKRRLLSNVIEMRPFSSVNPDWLRFLREIMSIVPNVWDFGAPDVAESMLRYTYGVRDNAVALLREALLTARAQVSDARVSRQHIESAYLSAEFSARRVDVEALMSHSQLQKRKDLWSPLEARHLRVRDGATPLSKLSPVIAAAELAQETPKVVVAEAAIRSQNSRILDAMHEEQMRRPRQQEIERSRAHRQSRSTRAVVIPIRKGPTSGKLADIIDAAADLIGD